MIKSILIMSTIELIVTFKKLNFSFFSATLSFEDQIILNSRIVPVFVQKSQLDPQILSCLNWVLTFENVLQLV